MKKNIADTIKMIRACLLAGENKPITTQQIFERCSGNIPMADIYYALQVMVERKSASRIKRGVYVLTDTNKPIDSYVARRKRKAKKATAAPVPFELHMYRKNSWRCRSRLSMMRLLAETLSSVT